MFFQKQNPIDFRKCLHRDFFLDKTELVAKKLIGKLLVRKVDGQYSAGKIVETEAYLFENDPACHASVGKTQRNTPMFGPGGTIYVYKIYGIHYCVNIVTETEGRGCAVLLRSAEPILGIDVFERLRGKVPFSTLLKGPGNLAKAFNFKLEDNGLNLFTPDLFIQEYENVSEGQIGVTTRVGIQKGAELPLRFYLKGSNFISHPPNI
ncbi:MAG: DNA-3-methyladenine glycosylase [Candidatus Kapaibacteriales bacterium]